MVTWPACQLVVGQDGRHRPSVGRSNPRVPGMRGKQTEGEVAMSRLCRPTVYLWLLGTGGGLLLTVPGSAADAPDPRPEKVLADWQKRQNWYPAVEYQV